MGRIHFIGGEKGGVGKSLVARLLAQHFIDRNIPFSAFDTDRSHPSLSRYYADFTTGIEVERVDHLDRLLETAAEFRNQRVLVDLAAQTAPALARWIEDSQLVEAARELDTQLAWWHVMDAGRDSTDLLGQFLDRFSGSIPLVLVLNEIRGERFDLLEESGALAAAKEIGAKIVHLRKLSDDTMRRIDARGASFWAALHPADDAPSLGLLERRRLKSWMDQITEQFVALEA